MLDCAIFITDMILLELRLQKVTPLFKMLSPAPLGPKLSYYGQLAELLGVARDKTAATAGACDSLHYPFILW